MSKIKAEYLWLDGLRPTASLRSKTKILDHPVRSLADLPVWGFDGSSTMQATGSKSDCLLKPVFFVPDPVRGEDGYVALCEVLNADGSVHASNTRAHLRAVAESYANAESLFGIEQEYTLFQNDRPFGWPAAGYPGPQGPYYCGVGSEKVFGRDLVELHLAACLEAGLELAGINAEVMPGQWEFQVGPLPPLEVSDQLWMARYLLQRLGEQMGISVSFQPKPVAGDWNGAGAHTNFSTRAMREEGGIKVIEEACRRLGLKHEEHIAIYGADNDKRLTGLHETCSIHQFRYGVSDRGASIRIPVFTANQGRGYLEDRRPAANMDPYQVCAKLVETVCEPALLTEGLVVDETSAMKA